jgi:predicted nucleic acid-binding protein
LAALIDTSVLIAAERGDLDLDRFLERHGQTDLALAAISASELLHGIHRMRRSARKIRTEAWVEGILSAIPTLSFDLACARAHARLGAQLARKGSKVGAHDLIIGASALAWGYSVITRDRRGYSKIPDLEVVLA